MSTTDRNDTLPDQGLASVVWHLEAYAGHWLPIDDLTEVTAWMRENHLDRATAEHPVVVRDGMITYGQDRSPGHVRAADREIITTIVPLRTMPPNVWRPTCHPASLEALNEVFRAHEWSEGFDGVCVDCSDVHIDEHGRSWCRRENACAWPCSPVAEAMLRAGIQVEDPDKLAPGVVLGDCLSPADNARAIAQ
jgi:hypothetical protein